MAQKDILDANLWYTGGALQNFYLQKDAVHCAQGKAAEDSACMPVVVANEYSDTGQRRFLTGSPEDFVVAYLQSDLDSRHAYELILQGRPCKLYYDVEFDRNIPVPDDREVSDADALQTNTHLLNSQCHGHEMTAKLIDYTLFMLDVFFNKSGYKPNGDRKRCLWTREEVIEIDSSTKTKFSRHIIFPGVIFKSTKHCGEFVKFIMEPRLIKPYLQILISEDMEQLLKTQRGLKSVTATFSLEKISCSPNCSLVLRTGVLSVVTHSQLAFRLAETREELNACRAVRKRYKPAFWPEDFVFVQKLVKAVASTANKENENVDSGRRPDDKRTLTTKNVRFVDLTVYTSNRNFRLLYSSKNGKTARFERIADPAASLSYSFYNAVSDRDFLLASFVSCVKYHLCRSVNPEAHDSGSTIAPLSFSWEDFFDEVPDESSDAASESRQRLVKSILVQQQVVDADAAIDAFPDYSSLDAMDVDADPLEADNDGIRPLLEVSESSSTESGLENFAAGVSTQLHRTEEELAEGENIFESFLMTPRKMKPKQRHVPRPETSAASRPVQPAFAQSPVKQTPQAQQQISPNNPNARYQTDPAVNHRRDGVFLSGDCPAYPELNNFIRDLARDDKNGLKSKIISYRDGGDMVSYSMKGNYRFCNNVGRHHRSNNIWFIVNVDRLCWQQRCFDGHCRDYRSPWVDLPPEVARRVAARRDAKFRERTG